MSDYEVDRDIDSELHADIWILVTDYSLAEVVEALADVARYNSSKKDSVVDADNWLEDARKLENLTLLN